MCIFAGRTPKWDREIPKSEPITAYKAIRINYDGTFRSPIAKRNARWDGRELHNDEIHGADEWQWKRDERLKVAGVHSYLVSVEGHKRWNPGIHCMTTARAAKKHGYVVDGYVIVRVSLWGRVIAYPGRKFGLYPEPGYLAQHARIEAIVSANPYTFTAKALKRYRGLKDERKKR